MGGEIISFPMAAGEWRYLVVDGSAAEEAGMSRVYAGIHFMSGNLKGRAVGECVAEKVDALNWRR